MKLNNNKNIFWLIFTINIAVWLIAACTTGHKYELLFPTIALFPGSLFGGVFLIDITYTKLIKTLVVGPAIVADLLWIIFEISFIDRKSHSMAPFELLLASISAFLIGSIGVGCGILFRKIVRK